MTVSGHVEEKFIVGRGESRDRDIWESPEQT